MPASHYWLHGALRRDRERVIASLGLPAPLVPALDAHSRLRGPYTVGGTLLRAIVPGVLESDPGLVTRHDIEILSMAPELRATVPATRETLMSMAGPSERTRGHSRLRTTRLANGTTEFLRDHVTRIGPRSLVVENAEHADGTDAELLALMLRRINPGLLRLVICSATTDLGDGPLAAAIEQYATCQEIAAPATEAIPAGDPRELARAYVAADCTADDPAMRAAYDALDLAARHRLHDRRAAELRELGDLTLRLGAIPFHLEHGSDRDGAGAEALEYAVEYCCLMGFYHATIGLGDRAREIIGWDQPKRRYIMVTFRMTTAYTVLGASPEAEELYDEARLRSTMPAVHMAAAYSTGMLYTRHHEPEFRDHDKARSLVNQAIAFASLLADPKDQVFQTAFMRNGLALVEVHQDNLREALRLVNEGIATLDAELGPDEHRLHRSVLHFNRGQVYAGLGMLDEAAAEYSRVIDLDPNYPEYHFDRGNILRRLGREDEALADYEIAIRLSPPFQEAYYNRGDIRMSAGDTAGALADFDHVLDLDPTFVDAYVNRAGIRLEQGDLDGALQDAEAGLEVEPGNPYLHVVTGQVSSARGEYQTSRAAFDQALAADPTLVAALSGRAVVAYQLDDLAAALADLQHAIELDPQAAELRFNRAMVHERAARWDAALADLEAAAGIAPDDADITSARDSCRARLATA